MAWKPTTDDWREIAAISASIAFFLVQGADKDDLDGLGDPYLYSPKCARAAELFVQTYREEYPSDQDLMLDDVAAAIRDGEDGWNAMRRLIKENKRS